MISEDDLRARNPFHEPLVTELIEDPARYRRRFSDHILIGETLQVFQPNNSIVTGPQGSGKSMLLNLVRYRVMTEWLNSAGEPPKPLHAVSLYLGISINLVRANYHAFGRRSASRSLGLKEIDENIEISCAGDFLIQYLLREFLQALAYLGGGDGSPLRQWFGVPIGLEFDQLAQTISELPCWFGYYRSCSSLKELQARCDARLNILRSFLNTNIQTVPETVMETKATWPDALHSLGTLFSDPSITARKVPLFVVIDQYEVLPELNKSHGTALQRLINTFIKARDPVVFYKIGARTHDWGQELRVIGAESRIEVGRDYNLTNLSTVLMRQESAGGWLFPKFAADVAMKRFEAKGYQLSADEVRAIFGDWKPEEESRRYFKRSRRVGELLEGLSPSVTKLVEAQLTSDTSPLDIRLIGAWVRQQIQRGSSDSELRALIKGKAWENIRPWWRKERVEVALLQVASIANQRRLYYGWRSTVYLAGGNITAFLLICAEIWDEAAKRGTDPIERMQIAVEAQSAGIYRASEQWRNRDRNEQFGGSGRFDVVTRLGAAIHNALVEDKAMSNPGHSGFSLRENDLLASPQGQSIAMFLNRGVNWGIFEERQHTSKQKSEGGSRRKWYLHPLFSPAFAIPITRVKEPLYIDCLTAHDWLFEGKSISFMTRGAQRKRQEIAGQSFLFEGHE